ncbi:hypothetical protein [Pacificimonas flava]|uniref:Uncharacterized protein n=1 Tax=Pacificimonas flava TaxID=1234595 RepID=M2S8L5_9SPHN|nr:hypothetical protein [Pacificimonas flava]EMD81720.1 hypothetical protein C725_2923 [Pacificimonas flava]MBB5281723.1 hypothetical protein [Pacificimonas flava]
MAFDFTALTQTTPVRGLPNWQIRLITAFRVGTMASRVRRDASERLSILLGGDERLRPFRIFVEELGKAWPDPFTVNPPCCAQLSFDEALMLETASLALSGKQDAFHAKLTDMLPLSVRRNLWHISRRLLTDFLKAAH